MGVMRWTFFERLRARHSEIEVRNTFGYLTKNTRITHGIEKTHCADAFCIAGNLKAKRLGYYFFLKGGARKRHQTPYEIKGFRLYDKVLFQGKTAFIFGRRSSGYFDIRTLDGERISASVSYKKLRLLEKRRTYLIELRRN